MSKHGTQCTWFGLGRRRIQSYPASFKTMHAQCGFPVVPGPIVQPWLTEKPSYQFWTSFRKVRVKRLPKPAAVTHLLASIQGCCCAHVMNSYLDTIRALRTPLACPYSTHVIPEKLVLATARDFPQSYFKSSRFPSAVACRHSFSSSIKQDIWCRRRSGQIKGGRFSNSTLGKHSSVAVLNESQGYCCRYCGDVRMYVALGGSKQSDGRKPDDPLEKRHHFFTACYSARTKRRIGGTESTPRISREVRPNSHFSTTTCNSRVAGWDAQRLPVTESSGWKSCRSENGKGVLKQLLHLSLLSASWWHSCFISYGGLRAPYFPFAVKSVASSKQRQVRKSAHSPRFSQVPAVRHAAGRREHTVTHQQCQFIRQIPELAAGALAPLPLFHAPAGTFETQWSATGICPSCFAGWDDWMISKQNSKWGVDEQQERQEGFRPHQGDDGLRNCGEGKKIMEKTCWQRRRDTPSVVHHVLASSRSSTAGLYQPVTLRAVLEAANAALTAAEWTLSVVPGSTALREAGQTHSPVLGSEKQSSHRSVWPGAISRGGPTVAPTTMSRAKSSQVYTPTTTIRTGATTETAPASGIDRSPRAVKQAGTSEQGTASSLTVGETTEGGHALLTGSTVDARYRKIPQNQASKALTILAAALSPAGLFRPQAVRLSFHVEEKTHGHQLCHFAGVFPVSFRWALPAFYSSSSAAAVSTPGMETRSARPVNQLSKKELKGLQGHPRRYKLMGGRPEFHHVDRNKNGHIIEPTDKFQVVMTTSKNNVHAQVLNKSRAYRTIFGSFAGNVGYRKRAQQEPRCAYRIGQNIARKCRRLGICQVDVKFRRIMRVEQLLQAFAAHGLGVTSITHEPRLPKCGQNSTKPRKRRRV